MSKKAARGRRGAASPPQSVKESQAARTRRFRSIAHAAATRILHEYPDAIAIVADGSVGRGDPLPFSDVDILVLVAGRALPEPQAYVDRGAFVTIGFWPLSRYRHPDARGSESWWARGQVNAPLVLHDPRRVVPAIVRVRRAARPSAGDVEEALRASFCDSVEYGGKLRNGLVLRDEILVRYAAQMIARKARDAVMVLNDLTPVTDRTLTGKSSRPGWCLGTSVWTIPSQQAFAGPRMSRRWPGVRCG